MINRQNWLDVRFFLHFLEDYRQNAPETIYRRRAHLRHLLEWADEAPLSKSMHLSPTLPAYFVDLRLAPSSIKKGLETIRHFYLFARDKWPGRYKRLTLSWIDTQKPARGSRMESHLVEHQFYTLDDMLKLAAVKTDTLRQERARVGACMLFLSGMRADALASLPVSCFDLARREVRQLPELGVRTKNRKAAKTYLLDIPELMAGVESWDRLVHDLPPASLWYSPLTRDGMSIVPTTKPHVGRGDLLERDLRILCNLASVPYLSPHKLRHGHVVFGMQNAHTVAELKAVSQNVMHASMTITDQVYGNLVGNDVHDIIGSLGKAVQPATDDRLDEILRLLRQQAAG